MLRGMLEQMRKDAVQVNAQCNGLDCGQAASIQQQGYVSLADLRPVLSREDILGKGIIILSDTIIGVPFPAICVSPAQGKVASHTVKSGAEQ